MGQCVSAAYGPDYDAEERATKMRAQGLTPMHAAAAAGDTAQVLRLGEEEEKLGWPGRSLKATNIHGQSLRHLLHAGLFGSVCASTRGGAAR